MKRISFLFSACAVLCFLVVLACHAEARAADDDDMPELVGPVPVFKVRTLKKRLGKNASFKAQYPQFGINFIDKDIERHVKASLNEFLSMGRGNKLENDRHRYEYELGYNIYVTKPGIISVVLDIGAGEGMWSGWAEAARTYDLSSQKILQLRDIFPDWKKSLNKLQVLSRDPSQDDDEECDQAYIKFDVTYKEYNNFYITPTKLVISYNGGPQALHETICPSVNITKATLRKVRANMRYWKKSKPNGSSKHPKPGKHDRNN